MGRGECLTTRINKMQASVCSTYKSLLRTYNLWTFASQPANRSLVATWLNVLCFWISDSILIHFPNTWSFKSLNGNSFKMAFWVPSSQQVDTVWDLSGGGSLLKRCTITVPLISMHPTKINRLTLLELNGLLTHKFLTLTEFGFPCKYY